MRVWTTVCLTIAVALAVGVASATAAGGGNSANAKKCQKNGWQTLFRADGTPFVSQEACVSYAAKGGTLSTTPGPCVVTATNGCLIFNNAVFTDGTNTVTVNGQWSFNTTCNNNDPNNECPSESNNNYARGSGSYVVTDASGAVVEQGTLRTANTAGAEFEGLANATYGDADGNPTSCSAAVFREVDVYASTGVASDPYAAVGANTLPDPSISNAFFTTINGIFLSGLAPAGVTLSC